MADSMSDEEQEIVSEEEVEDDDSEVDDEPAKKHKAPKAKCERSFACKSRLAHSTAQGCRQGRQGCQGPQQAEGGRVCLPGRPGLCHVSREVTSRHCSSFCKPSALRSSPKTPALPTPPSWARLAKFGQHLTRQVRAPQLGHLIRLIIAPSSQGALREAGSGRQGSPRQGDEHIRASQGCRHQGKAVWSI